MEDGAVLRAWMASAVPALEGARERIDAVNVFPVADGDTGTNVLLTLRGAADEVAGLDSDASGAEVWRAMARGALLAARGNSGMIVSRYLGGLAEASGNGLPAALERAATAAREAVHQPEDGTVLTVAAVVAGAAREATTRGLADAEALVAGADAGRTDLARISAAHPVLRSARVVDAGACALLVLLDALAGALAARSGPVDLEWLAEQAPDAADTPTSALADGMFEVMAVLHSGPGTPDPDDLGAALAAVGESIAVVDADGLRTAHLHTADPAAALRLLCGPRGEADTATVRQLVGTPRALVACISEPALAAPLALLGAVVLVLPGGDVAVEVARTAVDRAVQDAHAPAHTVPMRPRAMSHSADPGAARPVVVLPGACLDAVAVDPVAVDPVAVDSVAVDLVAVDPGGTSSPATPRILLPGATDDLSVLALAAIPEPEGEQLADALRAALDGLRTATAGCLAEAVDVVDRLWCPAPAGAVLPAPTITVLLGTGTTADDGPALADRLSARYPDAAVLVAGPVPHPAAFRVAVTLPPTAEEVRP